MINRRLLNCEKSQNNKELYEKAHKKKNNEKRKKKNEEKQPIKIKMKRQSGGKSLWIKKRMIEYKIGHEKVTKKEDKEVNKVKKSVRNTVSPLNKFGWFYSVMTC